MKIIVSFFGALMSGVVCFVIFSLVSEFQISQVGYTPNQSDELIDIFIVVAPLVVVAGGWLSFQLYKKHLTKQINSDS